MTNEELDMFLRQFRAAEEARMNSSKQKLRTLLQAYLTDGIAKVVARYSGYGDQGAVDDLEFFSASGESVDRSHDPDLEDCIYEFLPAGFEINDGGQGTVTIDVKSCKVTIAHEENYTETRNSSQEIDL